MVSILIAARNEEKNIINCLQAISRLSYPASDMEVLIGNDASEDDTAYVISRFIENKPNFRLFNITHIIGEAKGKANVLAQLVLHAKGDYLFITDADIQVPPDWIQTLLKACKPGTGIVIGTTLVRGDKLFHNLQSLDWLFAQGLIHLASLFKIPVTAMGNNMMLTRQAYQATGGYAAIPFSITEDYALFREVIKLKFGFMQVVQVQALAFTEPVLNFKELLQQRKRWMQGAFQLPVHLVLILLLQASLLPCIVALFFFLPKLAVSILIFKILFQSTILFWMSLKLKQFRLLPYLLLFEPYYSFISLAGLIHYILPGKIRWKGRDY